MTNTIYKIIPFNVGILNLGKDHVLGDEYSGDERIAFSQVSFLIQGAGKNVLVDLGCKTLEYSNEMFRKYGFFRVMPDGSTPDDITQPEGGVFENLSRVGLKPEDITDIVFTHFHADHHGMDDARDGGACEDFPNAVFHLSKRGWDFNVSQRKDGHWNSYIDWGFADCMSRKIDEKKAVAIDDEEIAPGLSTMYLGGHSVCSQAVKVETADGTVIIGSDDFYQYELLEQGIISKLFTTRERMIETNGMLADLAIESNVILPVHDPSIFEIYKNYKDSWLQEAKKRSYAAGVGFRDVWPK